LLLLTGCRRNTSSERLNQEASDSELTSQVEAKLEQDPALKAHAIHVSVQQGVASLTGEVGDDSEKASAEKLAADVSGVKQIIDLLTVATVQVPSREINEGNAAPSETAKGETPRTPATEAVQNQSRNLPQVIEEPPSTSNSRTRQLPPVVEEPPSTRTPQPPPPVVNQFPPSLPSPPPPQPVPVTVPAATIISVRMIEPIDSAANQAGQTFAASVASPVVVGNQVVIRQGADARVRLEDDQSAGHFKGRSLLKVELVSVVAGGTTYNVQTEPVEKQGASRGKDTGKKIGGGAAIGALIGGLVGGGKGAAIGAGIGGGAGAADQALTHAKQVKIPSEARLDFTLTAALTVDLPPGSRNP
jgi:hypothetical protein